MKIIVIGDGKVGRTIVEHICKEGHEVTIIDKDSETVDELVNLYDVLGICGNGASYDVLKEAGADKADLVVATTTNDETNILACLISEKIGAKASVARVRSYEYNNQLKIIKNDLGVDLPINPEKETANEITKILNFPEALRIDTFAKGICKYRLFNVASAMPLISHVGFKDSSARMIFNTLSRYLVTGEKSTANIGKALYEAVDKYKHSCPALTPNESQRRRIVNKPKRTKKPEVVKQVEEMPAYVKPITELIPCNYGIKIGNTIKLMLNEDCCKAYVEAYREFDEDTELKVVRLKFKVLEG